MRSGNQMLTDLQAAPLWPALVTSGPALFIGLRFRGLLITLVQICNKAMTHRMGWFDNGHPVCFRLITYCEFFFIEFKATLFSQGPGGL